MHMRTLIYQSGLVSAIVMLLNAGVTSEAAACSCLQPTVESSYNQSTDVVTADVRRQFVFGDSRYYVARVQRTFKGCLEPGDRVLLKTPADSGACGVALTDEPHLIQGTAAGRRFGMPVLSIGLCSYNLPVSKLTEHDLGFLNGRTVCCGDDCTCADGSLPVQCFVDPCSVAPECAEGSCTANYCGGCNAEFYDSVGNAVCQPESECSSDTDCPDGEWCRQAQSSSTEPIYACVPFVGEGQRCNGFTPPWLFEKCQPGLVCDTPEFVVDAPGICRRACETDSDCMRTGCSGQVCAVEAVVTTCEFRPEYACYDDPDIAHCGCNDGGACGWTESEPLQACLRDAASLPIE